MTLLPLYLIVFSLKFALSIEEEDIEWTPEQLGEIHGSDLHPPLETRLKRQIKLTPPNRTLNLRWPEGRVPYQYGRQTPQSKYMFKRAMNHVMARTCVRFEERDAENRLELYFGSGSCYSPVGRVGGVQTVVTASGCPTMGNAMHELCHALGFIHTVSRYDRDQYVNLTDDSDFTNYGIYTKKESTNVIPFEYGSVLMYTAKSFFQPLDMRFLRTMGTRYVTFYDMAMINRYYECKCERELDCQNGGYTNPANCSECNCPMGYGGILCDGPPREFSKVLNATENWKEHSMNFGFNGFSDTVEMRATMFIVAPRDKTIQVQVTNMYRFTCNEYCLYSSVEVKMMGDPRMTNPLFCCNTDPGWNDVHTSKLNPTPVNIYLRLRKVQLTIRYRYINGSVDDLPKTNNTFDSFEYPI